MATNPARQAAHEDFADFFGQLIREARQQSDSSSCQLISDLLRERIELERELDDFACELRDTAKSGLRLAKQLTRERDEAREAARYLTVFLSDELPLSKIEARWPWLKESP